jgi:hypothetical protein
MARNTGTNLGPPPAQSSDRLADVQRLQEDVRAARALLTEPTVANLNDCRGRLEGAVNGLRELQTSLPSGNFGRDAALRAPLGALRAEIARLTILLDGAAAFHSGWVRLAASMVAGYTAEGKPGEPEPSRSVWLEV